MHVSSHFREIQPGGRANSIVKAGNQFIHGWYQLSISGLGLGLVMKYWLHISLCKQYFIQNGKFGQKKVLPVWKTKTNRILLSWQSSHWETSTIAPVHYFFVMGGGGPTSTRIWFDTVWKVISVNFLEFWLRALDLWDCHVHNFNQGFI